MAFYKLVVKKSLSKDFKKIPKKDVQRILTAIRSLAKHPRPPQSKKLSGQERYRLRQGNYRILYTIDDEKLVVRVVSVADRRDAYR